MLNKLREVLGLRKPEEVEAEIRRKIARELRSSAFLHCDVNKEHVLLSIEHGAAWSPRRAEPPMPPCKPAKVDADKLVQNFRQSYPEIADFWKTSQDKMVPVTDFCATDERCGFPLHLPPTAEGGPSYPPHHAVKISGDSTECLDCGVRWDTNDPEPPAVCVPKDPMKYMFDAGFTDFPFKKPKTEVTSDKPHAMESLARNLFEQARCFKVKDRTYYEINPVAAFHAVTEAKTWLSATSFVSSGHAAVDELEQLIAAHLPGADHSTFLTTSFAEVLIRWCERNPLD